MMKIPMSADEQCRRKRSKSSLSPKKEWFEICTLRTRLKTSRKTGWDDEFLCLSHADPGCRCLFVLILIQLSIRVKFVANFIKLSSNFSSHTTVIEKRAQNLCFRASTSKYQKIQNSVSYPK